MKAQDYLNKKGVQPFDIPLNDATPGNALAMREAQMKGGEGREGILKLGKGLLDLGEAFGVEKRDIGKSLLKAVTSGIIEFPGVKNTTTQRKKLEVAVDQVIKLAWTFFGIFMVFQVFVLIVGVVT